MATYFRESTQHYCINSEIWTLDGDVSPFVSKVTMQKYKKSSYFRRFVRPCDARDEQIRVASVGGEEEDKKSSMASL